MRYTKIYYSIPRISDYTRRDRGEIKGKYPTDFLQVPTLSLGKKMTTSKRKPSPQSGPKNFAN